MSDDNILDIAHLSFLDMIQALIAQSGAASAKGTLVRNAVKAGERFDTVDFPTFEAFVAAIDTVESPIAKIEGRARHVGGGLFGLPQCPFAQSIANYKKVFQKLPDGYAELTAEYNKPGPVTERMHVGHGAGVSPFCSVHQPMRASLGAKITIGGKPVEVYQLGCKSATGAKGLAHKMIEETGHSAARVESVLDEHMCCYAMKVSG